MQKVAKLVVQGKVLEPQRIAGPADCSRPDFASYSEIASQLDFAIHTAANFGSAEQYTAGIGTVTLDSVGVVRLANSFELVAVCSCC